MSLMLLMMLVALVAMVYASVGHGGASGYLATLALLGYDPVHLSASALVLNVLVAGLAFAAFRGAGHFSWRLTWPFLVASIPAAALGGWLPVSRRVYGVFLAAALLAAALRLWLKPPEAHAVRSGPRWSVALPVGGGIGLMSGLVGVGGGIFLSPVLLCCRWADAKRTAATSALFIVVNSLAGLAGRVVAGGFDVGMLLPLVGAAFVGGCIGSQWGAYRMAHPRLCQILGVVLLVAAGKLVALHG